MPLLQPEGVDMLRADPHIEHQRGLLLNPRQPFDHCLHSSKDVLEYILGSNFGLFPPVDNESQGSVSQEKIV